jgi:hypothetical protein
MVKKSQLQARVLLFFNNSAETFTMQVDELAGSVELYGTADFDSNIFYKLTGNSSSFELVNKITTDGIYHFSIEGIAKIKFEVENTNKDLIVFCRMTKGV